MNVEKIGIFLEKGFVVGLKDPMGERAIHEEEFNNWVVVKRMNKY